MRLGKNGKLIRLSKSCLSSLEKIYVCKVLDKEFLGMGEEVNLFEKKYNSFVFIDYHNADVDNLNTHNDPKIPDVPTN